MKPSIQILRDKIKDLQEQIKETHDSKLVPSLSHKEELIKSHQNVLGTLTDEIQGYQKFITDLKAEIISIQSDIDILSK